MNSDMWATHFLLGMMTGQQPIGMAHVLSWAGASLRTSSMFYKAILQSVLLYSSETWTLSSAMLTVLGGFHN